MTATTITIYVCTRDSLDESGTHTDFTGDDCPVCTCLLTSSMDGVDGGVFDSDDCWCEDCGYVDSWVVDDSDEENVTVHLGNGGTGTELRVLDTHVPLNEHWVDHLANFNYEIVVDGEDTEPDESEEQLVPPLPPLLR